MSGYKQDCGSFHGVYSWNLQLMEAMEACTSTDSGKIHVRPWKLPLNFISANFRGNVHGSKYSSADIHRSFNESKLTSMEVNFGCTETSMGASGNVHGTKSKKGKIGTWYAPSVQIRYEDAPPLTDVVLRPQILVVFCFKDI